MTPFDEIMNRRRSRDITYRITENFRQASSWLPFSAAQICKVFDEDELELLATLVSEMQDATEENEKVALLIEKAETYSEVIVKLLELAGIC